MIQFFLFRNKKNSMLGLLAIALTCMIFFTGCTQGAVESIGELLGNTSVQKNQDDDGDGILNGIDNCPNVPNAEGQNLDFDRDGFGNACDMLNDLDSDSDTIFDMIDNCPGVPNKDQADANRNGVGDLCDFGDVDADGITDQVDNCPTVFNPSQDVTLGLSLIGDSGCNVEVNEAGRPSSGDACLNADADAVLDMVDNCTCNGESDQRDPDGDGTGIPCDADDDNDQIPDADDNCPLRANRDQINTDGADDGGNACDPNDDNDLHDDYLDNCPLHVNNDQRDRDRDGIGDECDPINNTRFENLGTFEEALLTGSTFEAPTPQPPMRAEDAAMNEMVTERVPDPMGSGTVERMYNCRVERYSASAGYNELFLLNPTTSVIYPGAIIDGSSIDDGRYVPLSSGVRRPMGLSVSILGGEASSATINDPNRLSEIRTGINNIVGPLETPPLQNSQLTTEEVYSGTHFGLSFGIDVEATVNPSISFSLGTNFSVNRRTSQRKYMSRFSHRYYTVDVDTPRRPADWYEEFPSLGNQVPVYVSSVTYGRLAFFEMDSRHTQTEVEAALNAGLAIQGQVDIMASFSARFAQVMREANVRATLIGGTQTREPINNVQAFSNFLATGAQRYQDGVPIAYTLRFLSNNEVARSTLSSTYNVRQCSLVPPTPDDYDYTIQIVGLRSSNNDGEIFDSAEEVYGRMTVGTTSFTAGRGAECRFSPSGSQRTIFQISRDENFQVFGSWSNVENRSFRTVIRVPNNALNGTPPATPNLGFCFADVNERDASGGDDPLVTNNQFRTLPLSQLEEHNRMNPVVFRGSAGNSWLEVRVAFIRKTVVRQ